MTAALLLSTLVSLAWAQGTPPCVPPNDGPIMCPEKYMPKPASPPTVSERDSVIKAIQKVSAARNAERAAIKELEKNLAKASEDPEKIEIARQAYRDLKALTEAKYAACDEAIHLAMIAYDLVPPNVDLSGPSGLPAERYKVLTWYPRYSEKEKWDPKTGFWRARTPSEIEMEKAENSIMVGGMPVSAGATRAKTRWDGSIAIFQSAFFTEDNPDIITPTPDPDRLALSIMHETSHWVEAAGTGGFRESDPPWHTFLGEYQAYTREAELARLLRLDDTGQQKLADQFHRQLVEGGNLKTWDEVRSEHPDWLISGERRVLAAEAEARGGEPDRPEHLKLEGELELLEGAQKAKALEERLRLEREERDKRERQAAEEKARKERDPRWRLEQIARSFGFEFEEWDRHGRPVFLAPPDRRYAFPVREWDEVEAALFLARSCIDEKTSTRSERALEILRVNAADSEFRKRIRASTYGSDFVTYCVDNLLENPEYMKNPSGIQEVITASVEAERKALEWERNNQHTGGGSKSPPRRGDRGDRERDEDRGGADLSPADRALERGKRIKLP